MYFSYNFTSICYFYLYFPIFVRSKTSSITPFINKVRPKIALIGVGKNNKFGHPNFKTIENLEKMGVKIFRTDENGEIQIKITNRSKIIVHIEIIAILNLFI